MRRTHGYRCVPNAIKIVCFDFHTPDDGMLEEGSLNAVVTTAGKIVPIFPMLDLCSGLDSIGCEV